MTGNAFLPVSPEPPRSSPLSPYLTPPTFLVTWPRPPSLSSGPRGIQQQEILNTQTRKNSCSAQYGHSEKNKCHSMPLFLVTHLPPPHFKTAPSSCPGKNQLGDPPRSGGSVSGKTRSFLRGEGDEVPGLCSYLRGCESRPQLSFPEVPTRLSCPYACHAARSPPGQWPSLRNPRSTTDGGVPEACIPSSATTFRASNARP